MFNIEAPAAPKIFMLRREEVQAMIIRRIEDEKTLIQFVDSELAPTATLPAQHARIEKWRQSSARTVEALQFELDHLIGDWAHWERLYLSRQELITIRNTYGRIDFEGSYERFRDAWAEIAAEPNEELRAEVGRMARAGEAQYKDADAVTQLGI